MLLDSFVMTFRDHLTQAPPRGGRHAVLALVLGTCLLLAVLIIVLTFLHRKPFLLGFAGPLSGEYADLGVAGRNGVRLAVETINDAGGIMGRKIELAVEDDLSTQAGALQAVKRLVSGGATAIVGHMTSSQSLAALPFCDSHGVPLISPTASSPLLSGRKDLFFRVQPATDLAARALADHMSTKHGLKTFCLVWDSSNPAFTRPYSQDFSERVKELGGTILESLPLTAPVQSHARKIARRIEALKPDGVLILASARDTATTVQAIRETSAQSLLASSEWARTHELFVYGGDHVEGLHVVQLNSSHMAPQAYQAFAQHYQNRFGRTPSYASAQGYNAVLVYASAMEKALGRHGDLPRTLAGVRDCPGVYGPMTLDEYGDLTREVFLSQVQDSSFVILESLGLPEQDPATSTGDSSRPSSRADD